MAPLRAERCDAAVDRPCRRMNAALLVRGGENLPPPRPETARGDIAESRDGVGAFQCRTRADAVRRLTELGALPQPAMTSCG